MSDGATTGASRPRVLLLQARDADDPVRENERAAFAEATGLADDRIAPHDLLEGPPAPSDVRHHDALLIGGSGDYYVSRRNLPHLDDTLDALGEIIEIGVPVFASCFGFQLVVEALRGEVVHDPENVEVGTYEMRLTDAGRDDPIFGGLPDRFPAQVGRKDRAERLPEGVLHLASSERCRYHALRIPGRPVWGTQFHPELDRTRNLARFRRYIDGYVPTMSDEDRRRALERFRESPEASRLLRRFLHVAC